MTQYSESTQHEGRIGIIDIGSNSVRLVVYDEMKRAPVALYNEKAQCGLGRGLASSKRLNADGVAMARRSLARFLALAQAMDVVQLHVFATAAVRDAEDGLAFVDMLEREHGIDIAVISGKKEAKLGAWGVCASVYEPKGVAGDLGGGSMELTRLDGQDFKEHASLPIGPLRLLDETKGNRAAMQKIISRQLENVGWLGEKKTPNFYAIGGTFRALAKMHLTASAYPLRVLHEYTVEAKAFGKFLDDLLDMNPDKLAGLPGAAAKRVDALAPGALVIKAILGRAKPEQVVFCAAGIREGYLYEKLSPNQKRQDPLLASSADTLAQSGRLQHYGQELFVWMAPLFAKESDDARRLRLAFCMLSEIAWAIHPEYRAEWAMHRILQSSLTGVTHTERVRLAVALYHRYQARMKEPPRVLSLLSGKEQTWARMAGGAAGLAYALSGSIPGSLHRTTLTVSKNEVALTASPAARDLQGDLVRKRLDALNDVYKSL